MYQRQSNQIHNQYTRYVDRSVTINNATVTLDEDSSGIPRAEVTVDDNLLNLKFHNLKGAEGPTDYDKITNKPKINNVELGDNTPLIDLGILPKLTDLQLANLNADHSKYLTEHLSLSGCVKTNDYRLTNERTPVAHTHNISDIIDLSSQLEASGKIDDVKVNGVSVVTDKVANIDLSKKQNTLNYYNEKGISVTIGDNAEDILIKAKTTIDSELYTTDEAHFDGTAYYGDSEVATKADLNTKQDKLNFYSEEGDVVEINPTDHETKICGYSDTYLIVLSDDVDVHTPNGKLTYNGNEIATKTDLTVTNTSSRTCEQGELYVDTTTNLLTTTASSESTTPPRPNFYTSNSVVVKSGDKVTFTDNDTSTPVTYAIYIADSYTSGQAITKIETISRTNTSYTYTATEDCVVFIASSGDVTKCTYSTETYTTLANLQKDVDSLDENKVDTTDSRLSDARPPLAHSHVISDVTDLQTNLDAKADKTEITAEYSATSTYTVGQYCRHNGSLYKCNIEIATGEDWTESHWSSVSDVLGELYSQLVANQYKVTIL